MKKFVLKLDLHDDKDKRKALKTVSALAGIDAISMDMKGKQLTVIGTVDPVSVVTKLRKFWAANIILVGPAKEPEKKEEAKKEEPKKAEDPKKEGEAKKEEPKKEEEKKDPEPVVGITPYMPPYYYPVNGIMPYRPPYPPVNGIMPYRPSYPPASTFYDAHRSVEENPNGCVIS